MHGDCPGKMDDRNIFYHQQDHKGHLLVTVLFYLEYEVREQPFFEDRDPQALASHFHTTGSEALAMFSKARGFKFSNPRSISTKLDSQLFL
jgi:hypothetical protein